MAVQFGILGPLEVRDGERTLVVRGAKQRLLLALLLLHANDVVSTDVLVDGLWGEDPPQTADKALQMHVSQLRTLLEPDRARGGAGDVIVTRAPGYMLRLDPSQLDLSRFEERLGDAKGMDGAAETASALRSALACWRGAALADVEPVEIVKAEVARLEELRVSALEDRINADLALAEHTAVIAELELLIAQHPLRERLRSQLMLALYRSGRQAEALEVYREARRMLVEELGIDPGRELRELEGRILAQDPALDLPPEAGPSPRDEGLLGRGRELAELRSAVDRALGGAGAIVLLSGEAGIGKSRLAEACALYAEERGGSVAVGRCWEAGGAPAFWPWTQVLRNHIRDTEPDVLRTQLGPGTAELAALLPEIAELVPESAAVPIDDDGARFRTFAAVSTFLHRTAAARPLALFLDDLHAADLSSLLLMHFMAAEVARMPIVIVGCYRDTEVKPALASAFSDLSREATVRRISLAGIEEGEIGALLERAIGDTPSPELTARVYAQTEGNPLFAVEFGRLLASAGTAGQRPGRLPIPEGVTDVIGRRVQRQSKPCRNVLAVASVIGREFSIDVLQRVGDVPDDELFKALEEATAARLIGAVPEAAGRLRFSHMLIRDALYEEIAIPARLQLHQRVAVALETVYSATINSHLAEIAHHFLRAGREAETKAIGYATLAGDAAASQHAYDEAAGHYESALDLIESIGAAETSQACELLLSLGEALSGAGAEIESKRALSRGAALAERHGWSDQLARAAIAYGGGVFWTRASTDPELGPLLERALTALGDTNDAARVRLLCRLASARRDDRTRERRIALTEEAVAVARRSGDAATLAYALAGYWLAFDGPDSVEDGFAVAAEMDSLIEEVGGGELEYAAHEVRLECHMRLAERAAYDVELDILDKLANDLGQPSLLWSVASARTTMALLEGDFARAELLIEAGVEQGRQAASWNTTVSERLQLFVLRRAQGRLSELEETIGRSVHEFPALLRFRCALAHLYGELGRESDARGVFDDLLSRDLGNEHVDAEWLLAMSLLADPCSVLADTDAAVTLHALLLPYERLYAHGPCEISFGCVARALGVLATTSGRFDEAERHFDAALEIERRMRARPWMAHAQHGLAAALLERDASGDRGRADELLTEAQETYRALGMQTWAARCGALAE